jgi:multisubunit Na+/H+ antiporter MnhE subunit
VAGAATIRAAIAGDIKLKPAIVRIRTRLTDTAGVASFAGIIGFAAGAIVVASDDEGLLAHVNEEDGDALGHVRNWEDVFDSKNRDARSP